MFFLLPALFAEAHGCARFGLTAALLTGVVMGAIGENSGTDMGIPNNRPEFLTRLHQSDNLGVEVITPEHLRYG